LLHPGDYVVCRDEKPSIQARQRKHRTLPATPTIKRGHRVEHEYERHGALCYFAAWDARRAKLFDRCAPTDGIVPFDALIEQFMSVEPYSKAQRVFVIVDFPDLSTLERQLLAFGRRYEQIAAPCQWKFTRADLDRLAHQLDRPAQAA
jgi:hypothetical protein